MGWFNKNKKSDTDKGKLNIVDLGTGTRTELVRQLAQDFCSSSRRVNRRIASYATVGTTKKTDKKTSELSKLFRARS